MFRYVILYFGHQSVIQPKHPFTKVSVTPGLSAGMLQDMIHVRLTDLRYAPMGSIGLPRIQAASKPSKLLFCLDDVNMASPDGATGMQHFTILYHLPFFKMILVRINLIHRFYHYPFSKLSKIVLCLRYV